MSLLKILNSIILSFFSAAAVAATGPAQNIAISDLTGQGVDNSSAIIISDRLRTEMFNTGKFKVLERRAMSDILKEQGFQQAGCTSDQCIVEIGQLLGVSRMVSGTIGKLGQLYTINARMIDVATGEIIYTTSVDCRCDIEDVLLKSVPIIAARLSHADEPEKEKAAVSAPSPPAPVSPSPAPSIGAMDITTDPPGAAISLDGSDAGLTPLSIDTIMAGNYTISIRMDEYETVEYPLTVPAGGAVKKQFVLEHTPEWNDSVKTVEKVRRDSVKAASDAQKAVRDTAPKKKRPALKIISGVGAVASAAAGMYFNTLVKKVVVEDERLKDEYLSANNPAMSATYQILLSNNKENGDKAQLYRSVSYGAAGTFAAFLAVSFAF